MHGWIVQTERILAAAGEQAGESQEPISAVLVAQGFDCWVAELERLAESHTLTEDEQRCLEHWLEVTRNQRSHLLYCYDVAGLPRTNNDMESFIRSIKTRYRRISGRKNWNAYLLRYGRTVAYYDGLPPESRSQTELEQRLGQVDWMLWRQARREARQQHRVQVIRFRFQHHRQRYLHSLEDRWSQTFVDT